MMVATRKVPPAVAANVAASVPWDGLLAESVAEAVAASLPQLDIAWGAALMGLLGPAKRLGPMMRAVGLRPMMKAATSAAPVPGQSRWRGPRTQAALARPKACRLWSRCTRSRSSALQLAAYVGRVCCRGCPAPGILIVGASCGPLTWMIPTLIRTRLRMMTLPWTGCSSTSCLHLHLPALHQAGHRHPPSICPSRRTRRKRRAPPGKWLYMRRPILRTTFATSGSLRAISECHGLRNQCSWREQGGGVAHPFLARWATV
mmetsp:Transcript_14570/g.37075  ORF Transcript_14570/g.37075 Transcript_14570/m.37075 type:complete len:260 (+) Transcript_14570:116-895(+)